MKYVMLVCRDPAIEVAVKHPVAQLGAIDVRPFWQE
jgi:hypothetical protein